MSSVVAVQCPAGQRFENIFHLLNLLERTSAQLINQAFRRVSKINHCLWTMSICQSRTASTFCSACVWSILLLNFCSQKCKDYSSKLQNSAEAAEAFKLLTTVHDNWHRTGYPWLAVLVGMSRTRLIQLGLQLPVSVKLALLLIENTKMVFGNFLPLIAVLLSWWSQKCSKARSVTTYPHYVTSYWLFSLTILEQADR